MEYNSQEMLGLAIMQKKENSCGTPTNIGKRKRRNPS
jgi:hypothetical protein